MLNLKFWWILVSIIPLQLRSQSVEPVLDSAQLMALAKEFRNAMMADFKPTTVVPAPEFARLTIPTGLSPTQLKEALGYFSAGFFFGSGFNPDELLVDCDYFFFPDARHVLVDYQWTKALDNQGKNYLDPVSQDNKRQNQQLGYMNSSRVKLSSAVDIPLASVEGDFNLTIPTKYDRITLTADDLQQVRKINKYDVRLFRLDKDIAGIWVNADAQRLAIYPLFGPDLPLSTSSVSIMNYDPKDASVDEIIPKQPSAGTIYLIKAKGPIRQLAVLHFVELSKQKLKIKAVPHYTAEDMLTKERYVPFAPFNFTNLEAFDEQSVRLGTGFALKEHQMMGDEAPQWEFEVRLPPMVQSKFSRARFSNLKVYQKKKLLTVIDTTGYFDEADMTLATMPENADYKKLPFDRIMGEAVLMLPAKIQTVTIKKGEKKAGIVNISGNEVTVSEEVWDENLQDIYRRTDIMAFRAYGKGKFPLKKDSQESFEYQDDVSLRKYYFHGPVTSVQVDVPSDWINVVVPFDISRGEPVKKKTKGSKKS